MTETAQTIHDMLQRLELFSSCSDDFLTKISSAAHLTTKPKGHMLFIHEDQADYFYLVKSGWVKIFRETLDGDQAIVDIFTNGHILGETSIFQDDIYPYSAETIEPSELVQLPLSMLKDEIETNPKFAMAMLSSMARYRKQQDQELEHRTLQNAPQRIGCFLLRLTDQSQSGGPVRIHLPYDKTLVASRLGMQPETFSRALKKLKQETGIEVKGSTIETDSLDRLVRYSCAACTSEFPCKDLETESG